MARSKDLFDDSTMSFGEHLEILRVHLWRAIIGLSITVLAALFFGDRIVAVVRRPIDLALQERGKTLEDDIGGTNFLDSIKAMISGEPPSSEEFGITDHGLDELKSLTDLEQLNLTQSQVSVEGLRDLKQQFPNLQTSFDSLRIAGLAELRGIGARCDLNDQYEPIALYLRGSQVGDEHLKLASSIKTLRRLDLRGASITDEGAELLKSLGKLEDLNLSGTAITDESLEQLAVLTNLKSLNLFGTKVTDEGVGHLSGLTKLEVLDLRRTNLSDKGLAAIAGLSALKSLHLSGMKITDRGLEHLKGLTNLERLTLAGVRITDVGLESLTQLTKLKTLAFESSVDELGQQFSSGRAEPSDERSIAVRIKASEFKALMKKIEFNEDSLTDDALDEQVLSFQISAPEFATFKKTSEDSVKPVTLTVQEAFVTYLKVSFVAGFVLASPWVFYQLWLFVAAGLYPHEQKYVYIYLPMSITLFVGGATFCFFLVFPFVLDFLLGFNDWLGVNPQIRLSEWITFAIMLPVMFGLSFQLPLVMLFMERISIFDVNDYRTKRRMAILVISIVSMLMTPADPMSMLLMMMPLIGLYELGIIMCGFSPTSSPFAEEEKENSEA